MALITINIYLTAVIFITFMSMFLQCASASISIQFTPADTLEIYMGDTQQVQYIVLNITDGGKCALYTNNPHISDLDQETHVINSLGQSGNVTLKGNFIGHTFLSCKNPINDARTSRDQLDIKCLRKPRTMDSIFTGLTATLVAVIFINFGCAVHWGGLRNLLKKPVGPLLCFCGQFVLMPMVSYSMGLVLFPDNPAMRLGMFFTGVSPGGGASNIWTAILEGNIDLSIVATAVSTVAAFGMMPLWLFTLGATIFSDADIEVPYSQISTYVVALIVPLGVGYLIQRYFKNVGLFLKRILKGFSSLLILFIIIFAIVTNLYLFELFSWQILVAGMVIPWMGYAVGYVAAKVAGQSDASAIAIAVEIGIQNTGISIFLLRFALDSVEADLTTVIPVSVAIMTPFPLGILFVCKKIKQRFWHSSSSSSIQLEKLEGEIERKNEETTT